MASHSAVGLHSGFGLCCGFGFQAHFGIPLFIHSLLWVQTPGWISLALCNGPPTLGLASTSFCAYSARSGIHCLVCLLPSFRPLLWNWPTTLLLTRILQWPSTLVATTLTYLASQPCFDRQSALGLNSPRFSLPPPFRPPICNGPQLSLFQPPTPVFASNPQGALTALILASYPCFSLQSSMGSKSHQFSFLHALWSSTRNLASTPQWASRHHFSLLSLFWLSHCNSPQPLF